MPAAGIPRDEEERLRALYDYRVLDTMYEESFDAICRLASTVCDTPIALISLVDRHRQWHKAHVGWDVREFDRECSFCAHALLDDDLLVVEDAERDQRFQDNALVLSQPKIRFYGGEPLHAFDGNRLGTLCVIDQQPRQLAADQKEGLRTLARQVERELEVRRLNAELASTEARRERLSQFVLHDLRNPLTAIRMTSRGLDAALGPSSSLREMTRDLLVATDTVQGLVDDLRDTAVARAGHLAPRWQTLDFDRVVDHVRATAAPLCRDAEVSLQWDIREVGSVEGDPDLLMRLVQNLVLNAVDHSPAGGRVIVRVESTGADQYAICVDDEGPGVSPETRERVFDLYSNAPVPGRRSSRGIGLAFCRAAVEAHGGTIDVYERQPRGSTFCAHLPSCGRSARG